MALILSLRRSHDDRLVAGLCGAVAARWRVDPVLVRVGWVLLALSGGIGAVLYLAGWALLPPEGSDRSLVDRYGGAALGRWPRVAWLVIVLVACLLTGTALGGVTPFSAGPALVVAAVWYLVFYRRRADRTARHGQLSPPPEHTTWAPADRDAAVGPRPDPSTPGPAPVVSPLTDPGSPTTAGIWPQAPRHPAPLGPTGASRAAYLSDPDPTGLYVEPPPVLPVRRSQTPAARRLRLVCVSAVGLVLTVLGLIDRAGTSVPATAYAAGALLVVGLTLVVAAWTGRARGILPVGLLLAVVVAGSAVAGEVVPVTSWSSVTHAYHSVADLPPAGDEQSAGDLTVDLHSLRLSSDTTYRAHLGTGSLTVLAPPDTPVRVRYTLRAGVVSAFDTVTGGTDLSDVTTRSLPGGRTAPTLTLDLSVGQGVIEVAQ